MFGLFKMARKKRLSFEKIQILQLVAQQVVLSLESHVNIPGAQKKVVALKLIGELLEEMDIIAPESLVETSIEASVSFLKSMDKVIEREIKPNYTFDIGGRPKSGRQIGASNEPK